MPPTGKSPERRGLPILRQAGERGRRSVPSRGDLDLPSILGNAPGAGGFSTARDPRIRETVKWITVSDD
jgi:hypothetical protein